MNPSDALPSTSATPTSDLRSPSSGEVLVKVENVRKKFCRSLKRSLVYGLTDMVAEVFGGSDHDRLRKDEFWATDGVSFELKRGECLGLIGHNGAGKTTLLKMLNGLIKPDHGTITMHGRIGALIALGSGFNPILSGRENIYVNGSVLGLTKSEIDQKMKEIIDFAEIHEFIDTPVQSYSSGMQVRLGFAVATALKPDVLLLDEVLAVGDLKFREKCLRRIATVLPTTAVIFVSHNSDQIRTICTTGIVMQRGKVIYKGEINSSLEFYHDHLAESPASAGEALSAPVVRYETQITKIEIQSQSDQLRENDPVTLVVSLSSKRPEQRLHISLVIYHVAANSMVTSITTNYDLPGLIIPMGSSQIRLMITQLALAAGRYRFEAYLLDELQIVISRSGTETIFSPFNVNAKNRIDHHRNFNEFASLDVVWNHPVQ